LIGRVVLSWRQQANDRPLISYKVLSRRQQAVAGWLRGAAVVDWPRGAELALKGQ
jgi:hypothetical protein